MRRAVCLGRIGFCCVLLLSAGREASAQTPPVQVNQNCTVSVLNRTVTANADGTWILPNVPANFGPVRARVTCVVNGQTVSGESDPFTVPANGAANIPQIYFGQTTPIPTALTIAPSSGQLTQAGAALQLTVTARYPDNSTRDVTPGMSGTTYTVSNPAFATIDGNGRLLAVTSGTVLVQATHEGASGMTSVRVALGGGNDTDGDGIPDADELALRLNPNNAIDAMEDFDRDNLTNLQEYQLGTDLRNRDSDGDGLRDGDEVTRGTNPLLRDSDGDGISDGLEVQTGSDPLNPGSFNLAGALSSIAVAPSIFTLTFNTIAGDASVLLRVTGSLRDGATIDLTSPQRGTSFSSNDLNVCNFGSEAGRVFAGQSGGCTITATVAGFTAVATGTVTTFAPIPLSSISLGGPGNGVDVAGDYVYVAAGGAGLKVVDVVNRSAPRIAATLGLVGTANDVKLAGTRAYIAAGAAGLHIVDVSNPLVPRLMGSVDTPGDAQDVRPTGNFAVVADGGAGLHVIDISNAAVPRIVGSVAAGPAPGAVGVDVEGTLAVVANGSGGLRVVSIANPAAPVVLSSVQTADARDVVVDGGFAYVADFAGSLRAVDFRNPLAPVLGGTTPTALGGILLDIARMDSFVFGADIFFVNGVPIVDVSDANNLRPRAILNFPGDATGLGIAVDGSYVYLGTDTSQLYIGQYRIQQDNNGIPPSVSIASPASGATFVEGETIPVSVTATDDLAVTSVTLQVDGATFASDTTAPYQFDLTAPTGGAITVVLGALAGDFGNNTGVASDVIVNVIPDPLTTVEGRVVLQGGPPVAGASVTCVATTTTTLSDGTFSISGLSTVQPIVACIARWVDPSGAIFGGISAPLQAVRAGVTMLDDIVIAPVPIIASITPNVVDALKPPSSLQITGSNLLGATFSFAPLLTPPAITAAAGQINATGTAATIPVTVAQTARGRFTMIGTNTLGAGDATPAAGNTLTVINAQDDVDSDGDGFADGLELLYGSDPLLASSLPNLSLQGDVSSRTLSLVNRLFPSEFEITLEALSRPFTVVNRLFPLTSLTLESHSRPFSIVNRLFPLTSPTTLESQSRPFSVVNSLFPSTLVTTRESQSRPFSLQNDPNLPPTANVQQRTAQTGILVSLSVSSGTQTLIEGQSVVVSAELSGAEAIQVEFGVNGEVIGTDTTAPHRWLFTVPARVPSVTFDVVATDAAGNRLAATPIVLPVQPDSTIAVSGRVVDRLGNPLPGTLVEVLSEGVDAEFFDFSTALSAMPNLAGRAADRLARLTAINMRNPNGTFGTDPIGSRLTPDYAGRLTGWLNITNSGTYAFILGANDGARLVVNGLTLIDMPVGTGQYQERQGSIVLAAGPVPIQVNFYHGVGGELKLSFTPPGGATETVSPSLLIPSGRAFTTRADAMGVFSISGVPTALASIQVRATSVDNSVTGLSSIIVPAPTTDTNVGDVVVPIP